MPIRVHCKEIIHNFPGGPAEKSLTETSAGVLGQFVWI